MMSYIAGKNKNEVLALLQSNSGSSFPDKKNKILAELKYKEFDQELVRRASNFHTKCKFMNQQLKCIFCGGSGHVIQDCGTGHNLKKLAQGMNKHDRFSGFYPKLWGAVKHITYFEDYLGFHPKEKESYNTHVVNKRLRFEYGKLSNQWEKHEFSTSDAAVKIRNNAYEFPVRKNLSGNKRTYRASTSDDLIIDLLDNDNRLVLPEVVQA